MDCQLTRVPVRSCRAVLLMVPRFIASVLRCGMTGTARSAITVWASRSNEAVSTCSWLAISALEAADA